ncbi:MAG: TonB family protein [Bacteroidota bacterium]
MRLYIILIASLLFQNLSAQNEATTDEDKIFKMVSDMPRFPGCEVGVMTAEERKKCAENNLLRYIYANIQYPDSARAHGTEGKVVIQFVVEKDGLINDAKVLKDIGDGCGDEALRVVNLMREQQIRWRPGKQNDEPVNVSFTLPISFKLEKYTPPPPYSVYGSDSIYFELEKMAEFEGGEDNLQLFLATNTDYPKSGLDSCLIGTMKSEVIVRKDGSIQLLETVDYSNLGTDFLFEVIKLTPKLENKWTPAIYEGKPVTSIYPIRVEFRPTNEGCKNVVTDFEAASKKVLEGVDLHNAEKSAEGLALINEALEVFPNNTEWLYYRGIIQINLKNNEAACEDFQRIRNILVTPFYENWIDVVCGF